MPENFIPSILVGGVCTQLLQSFLASLGTQEKTTVENCCLFKRFTELYFFY